MKSPIPFKIEVTLESQDHKLRITKRIWSDELAEQFINWQEMFWTVIKVEHKKW